MMTYTIAPEGSKCDFPQCGFKQGAIHVIGAKKWCGFHSPVDTTPEERKLNLISQ